MVDVGDSISSDMVLVEESHLEQKEIIPVGKLLNVRAESIHHCLKRKIGDCVEVGEILAGTKSFFSSKSVKSPVAGRLLEIDLSAGTLTISKKTSNIPARKIKSPIKGKVKNITKTTLEIEVEGDVFSVLSGGGGEAMGKLVYIGKENLGILDISADVENCIVASHGMFPGIIVKLEVMGAVGLVVVKELNEADLPWVQVNSEVFKKLAAFDSKMVWLRPTERQIVCICH